jgi:hypothetical protein
MSVHVACKGWLSHLATFSHLAEGLRSALLQAGHGLFEGRWHLLILSSTHFDVSNKVIISGLRELLIRSSCAKAKG